MHAIRIPPESTAAFQLKDYYEKRYEMISARGHFIELIIEIEEDINKIIEKSMISKKSKFKTVFSEKILNSRSISLAVKIDIFEEIVREGKYLKQEEQEEFFKSLKTLITERNRWAHGPIFYQQGQGQKLQPYLRYVNSKGKLTEQKLTKEYFDGLDRKLRTIHEKIEKILIKMKLLTKQGEQRKEVH